MEGRFTLEDFPPQLQQVKKLGRLRGHLVDAAGHAQRS